MDDYESRWFWNSCEPKGTIVIEHYTMMAEIQKTLHEYLFGNLYQSLSQTVEFDEEYMYLVRVEPTNPPQDNNKPTTNG